MTFDPEVVEYKTLLQSAAKMECTAAVYTHDDDQLQAAREANIEEIVTWDDSLETRQVKKSEQKYYLRNSILGHLPLSEWQAVKMNAALAPGDQTDNKQAKAASYLSPRQRVLLQRIENLLEQDADELAGFSFPEDQSDLIDYHQNLLDKLMQLEE